MLLRPSLVRADHEVCCEEQRIQHSHANSFLSTCRFRILDSSVPMVQPAKDRMRNINKRAGASQLRIAVDQDQGCIHHTVSEEAISSISTRASGCCKAVGTGNT